MGELYLTFTFLHQQQCGSNIVKFYKSKDSFDEVECCFDIVAVFGNNVERVFREISSFRPSRNKLNTYNLFRTLAYMGQAYFEK